VCGCVCVCKNFTIFTNNHINTFDTLCIQCYMCLIYDKIFSFNDNTYG